MTYKELSKLPSTAFLLYKPNKDAPYEVLSKTSIMLKFGWFGEYGTFIQSAPNIFRANILRNTHRIRTCKESLKALYYALWLPMGLRAFRIKDKYYCTLAQFDMYTKLDSVMEIPYLDNIVEYSESERVICSIDLDKLCECLIRYEYDI